VDYLLRGEAEATLAEFVRQLEGNAGRPQVPGLCHRGSDGPVCVPQADPPQDLDSIPFPDRGLLRDNYRRRVYYRLGRRPPADMIMTSRGCPFRCRFCFNVGKGYRLRAPANVVRELVYLRSLGITTIDFMDELFTGHRTRCMEICRLIGEAGLKLDLKIRSHVRTLDREMLLALKKAGVSVVLFGVESGSDAMLTAMHKNASVADNARAIRLVKQAGMRCYADILLGFPGETRETIAETDRFLRRVRPTAIQVGTLLPFPGTWVHDQSSRDGTLVGRWGPDQERQPFVRLPWAAELPVLLAEKERLRRSFFLDPRVMLGLAWHLAFRMDARQWLRGFRAFRGWLHARARVAPAPPRPVS
jgi:anaerobic magnesium-protoporphyrin IX monomethyl ester cyclase